MLNDRLVPLGVALVFIGVIMIVIGSFFASAKDSKTKVKSAGIIFIGPIPLGWASDKQTFFMLLGVALLALAVWLLFSFRR